MKPDTCSDFHIQVKRLLEKHYLIAERITKLIRNP